MSRKKRLETQLAVITDELIKMERRPEEPSDRAITVVHFAKKYASRTHAYLYVAMRAVDGKWYITGPQAHLRAGRTWDELLDFVEVEAVNDSLSTLRLGGKWKLMVADGAE